MLKITSEFVISTGQNPAAVKNGCSLVKKGSFSSLNVDKDETIIFGACQGSGKNPYYCSVDFIDNETPVFRCSCPSRQIPCKHVIGLMWAYSEKLAFTTEDIPEDIVKKRENKEKRLEKKQEKQKTTSKAPKTDSWKKTAIKKIDAQINGINEGRKLLKTIVETGIGSVDAKVMSGFTSIVKQLDSYYINGIQNEFFSLLELIKSSQENDKESNSVVIKICAIQTLLNKSEVYLTEKKNAPDKLDTTSEIEELIGYPWKLEELKEYGFAEENAELVQLAFHVVNEPDKKQFVDVGYYVNLKSGKICLSKNYRPYKAVKHIKEENSTSSVIKISELFTYPGVSLNPRVRWNSSDFSELTPDTCTRINELGNANFAEVLKTVKNQLKNLMLDPFPAVLIRFNKIYKTDANRFVIEDGSGNKILLDNNAYFNENFMHLLNNADIQNSSENSVLAAFNNDITEGVLSAHPLALITNNKITKLLY